MSDADRPLVAVLSTGGTIASTDEPGGATPTKDGADLLSAVPALDERARVESREVARAPSFDAGFGTVLATVEAAREAVDGGADGAVVTHGTDTMAESAYALDLLWDRDAPVVFTGAQRRPDEPSADGPANLLTAVRLAASDRLADAGGAFVAFDEELHAARDVRKLHASKLAAFASPDAGPTATAARETVRFHRAPDRRGGRARLSVDAVDAAVETVATGIGAGGGPIERAVEAGVDGLVVEATGLGNVTAPLGEALAEAAEAGVPVVVTTRCPAGAVAPVYGTPGGGRTLADRGAILGGDLPAAKARIALTLALSAGRDPAAVFAAERNDRTD